MEERKSLIESLYKRIELEVESIAMQNRLYDELDYAENNISDEEECMYYIRRVENTLDTL